MRCHTRAASSRKTTCSRAVTAFVGGALALLLPTIPVHAQEGAGTQGGYAEPPPVQMDLAPAAEPASPDASYEQESTCVSGEGDGERRTLDQVPWGQQHLRVEEAHQFATGADQTVAVIDTGVEQHNYFSQPVRGGGDYVTDDGNGLDDCDGHGTLVAGIIAGNPPRGQGVPFRGVAPDAQILSIRQTSENFETDTPDGPNDTRPAGTTSTLAQSVVLAASQGADVINISVDNCRPAGPIREDERRLQAALRNAVEEYDAVVVASAGNKSEECPQNDQPNVQNPQSIVTPPWFAEDVLSVAAIEENGSVADFSVHGPWVSVAAPGTRVVSLDPANRSRLANRLAEADGQSSQIKGTSFAAPYVSGVVALVRERFPDLTAREVMHRVTATAQHPAAPGGRDSFVGHGAVNPIAALTDVVPEEENVPQARAEQVPADLPPPNTKDWEPLVIALTGAGGAVLALGITIFVLHAVRRHRGMSKEPRGSA